MYYDGDKGELPKVQKGISLSSKGVLVTAYGENRDGGGTILRLWEQAGKEGSCIVTLLKGNTLKRAYPCNLRGEITNKNGIAISNNSFKILIHANQPVSFILR